MKQFFLSVLLSALLLTSCNNEPMQIVDLQCERLSNPIGIDASVPRFTWQLECPRQGAGQTAYRILIDTDSVALSQGKAGIWDSGKCQSDSQLVVYAGSALKSFACYFWKVIVWDENGTQSQPSPVASFETAMLDPSDWQGEWISDGQTKEYKPAPYFRKEIQISGTVKTARVYLAAAGLYELSVNGEKIGDRMLDPMYTYFDKRNLYAVLDITSQLKEGKNAIGILLGNGWYNHQSTAVWYFDKAPWRNRPRFLADIKINYEDGTTETFVSDATWKTTGSPIVFNSIYTAEHYDARKQLPGWDAAGFDDSAWNPAVRADVPSGKLEAQQLCPIRVTERLQPVKMDKKSDTCYVFTFPINTAGVIDIRAKGNAGTELRIIQGELLDKNGYVCLSNIDLHYRPTDNTDPFQTDIFILSGDSDRFSPKFNYKGFQYAEVRSSQPVELTGESIDMLVMHSDVPQIGTIKSSNAVIDKIWQAANNSYLSNLFGYPTDCPQREKNGWTGDSHIAVETGLYNFDAITVYEKWLRDFQDGQRPNGLLPNIVPTSGWGFDWATGPDWTSAIAIIPWKIYEFYGDNRLLHVMYDPIKRYVDYIHSISPNDTTDWGLGDWVPVKTVSSKTLTSSLFYYADATILSKTARMFGKTDDAATYSQLAGRIKNAINAHFLDKEKGIYCSGSQTELATPLYWGIVPDDLKEKVAFNLYNNVKEKNFHVDAGILGAKALLHALSENGYADAAYRVASQETYPSWGYWIAQGATTLYENWRVDDGSIHDMSFNHIMFGDISAWMFKGLGGIVPDENKPGFRHIILRPHFVEGLDQFEASHCSPYGKIVSGWKRSENKLKYTVEIPVNCTATLYLPEKMNEDKTAMAKEKPLKSGKYEFIIE